MHANWKKAVAEADKRAEERKRVNVGPHAADDSDSSGDSDSSCSELDENAHAKVARLPRLTSSRKLEQANAEAVFLMTSDALRSPAALRKAAPLPPPHGSGGPFHMLDRDVVVLVLSNAIGSLEDYAHISRTCLLFNDAAVSKGVLSAVVSAATSRARQAHDEAVEAGKTAREKVATAGTNAVTFDLEPGSMQLASLPINSKLVAHGVYDSPSEKTWSEGTYCKTKGELREHGLCVIEYEDSTLYKGQMCRGDRHGLGVEFFTDGERACRFEGEWVKDERHGRGLLLNGDFFDAMLGSYKWGEPFGIHICLGAREGAVSAGEDAQFIFYGPEPRKKPTKGSDGYVRR